jgi:hypothetical protein
MSSKKRKVYVLLLSVLLAFDMGIVIFVIRKLIY